MDDLDALRSAVLAALSENGHAGGVEAMARVCQACIELLPVSGAAMAIMSDRQPPETVYASDAVATALEDLQQSLGEGPGFEAYRSGGPVLVPDLATVSTSQWPVFAAQASKHPVRALFAFPMQIGAIRIGTLNAYRVTPGLLTETELCVALRVTDTAVLAVSALLSGDASWLDREGRWLEGRVMRRQEVNQAIGMLIVQLNVPAADALARLRAYAFAHERSLLEVASDVVARRLTLADDKE